MAFLCDQTCIADLWNGTVGHLSFQAPDWVPGIGGKGFSMPQLPHLAQGGVVPATRGGRLIVAGEGGEDEIVAPEGKLRSMLAGAGGIHVSIDARGADATTATRLEVTARRIAREVVYEIAKEASYS